MEAAGELLHPCDLLDPALHGLQEYVQHRIGQMMAAFHMRLQHHVPGLPTEVLKTALQEALATVPPPEYACVPLEQRDLQLVFRHDCM